MGNNIGVFLSGGPDGDDNPIKANLAAEVRDGLTLNLGGTPTAMRASVTLGGTTQPLQATVAVEGTDTPLAADLTANIGPLSARVDAEIRALPEVGIRLKELPPFELDLPSEYTVGFSIFGFELFAFTFTGDLSVRGHS